MSLPKFEAPKPNLKPRRQAEISFRASAIAAGAYGGQASGRVSYPFRVVRAEIHFTEEHNNLVGVQFLTSGENQIATTGYSGGTNMFGAENPSATFYGKGIIKRINSNIEYPEGNVFIKFSVYNGTNYVQTVTGSIIVEEM